MFEFDRNRERSVNEKQTNEEGDMVLQREKRAVMKSKSYRDGGRYVSLDVPANLMAIYVTVHILLLY